MQRLYKSTTQTKTTDMCIFRSEFSAVDNNETFGRNISFNDTFISSFQKIKSQKDLNSLIVHGACVSKVEEETGKYYGLLKKTLKPLDSLYSSAPQWMKEGSFFGSGISAAEWEGLQR